MDSEDEREKWVFHNRSTLPNAAVSCSYTALYNDELSSCKEKGSLSEYKDQSLCNERGTIWPSVNKRSRSAALDRLLPEGNNVVIGWAVGLWASSGFHQYSDSSLSGSARRSTTGLVTAFIHFNTDLSGWLWLGLNWTAVQRKEDIKSLALSWLTDDSVLLYLI